MKSQDMLNLRTGFHVSPYITNNTFFLFVCLRESVTMVLVKLFPTKTNFKVSWHVCTHQRTSITKCSMLMSSISTIWLNVCACYTTHDLGCQRNQGLELHEASCTHCHYFHLLSQFSLILDHLRSCIASIQNSSEIRTSHTTPQHQSHII